MAARAQFARSTFPRSYDCDRLLSVARTILSGGPASQQADVALLRDPLRRLPDVPPSRWLEPFAVAPEAVAPLQSDRRSGALEFGVDCAASRLKRVADGVLILSQLCSLAHRSAVLTLPRRALGWYIHGRRGRHLSDPGTGKPLRTEPRRQLWYHTSALVSEGELIRHLGRHERRQVGDHGRRLRTRFCAIEDANPLVELVHRQPALGRVLAQYLCDLIPIGIPDPQRSGIRVCHVPTLARTHGEGTASSSPARARV